MVHNWATAIDKRLVNGVVLLDLHKALDLVNHRVLLKQIGHVWMFTNGLCCSRANNRRYFGTTVFFIVFMNDMPMYTRTISTVDMCADDSTFEISNWYD